MPKLPKLKVKWWSIGYAEEETICDFEQAKEVVFGHGLDIIVSVEGQMIASYEELVQLVAQEQYKDKEALEVILVATAIPGG